MKTQITKSTPNHFAIHLDVEDVELAFMQNESMALKAAPVGAYNVDLWGRLIGPTPECGEDDPEELRRWNRECDAGMKTE